MNSTAAARAATVLWTTVAVLYLLVGVYAFFDPPAFVRELADFGRGGEHYVRDIGAAQIALAGLAGAAAWRREWRRLALAVIGAHFVLHSVGHVIDRHHGTPDANRGVLITLVAQGVALALAWWLDRHR